MAEEEQAVPDAQAYAAALKLELPPAPPPLSVEESAAEAMLASAVLKDYIAVRPGPESFPSMAMQVITLLGRRDADIPKLAELVSRDPGLSALLLRVINSALYRTVQRVVVVRDAIVRMGLGEAGRVASAAAAKVLFEARNRTAMVPFIADLELFYVHSVTTAMTASWMATQRPGLAADRCYLGGLLHDIGRSIALRSIASLHQRGNGDLRPRTARTYRVLEALHVSVGSDVLQAWQLPAFIVDMANKHHGAALSEASTDQETKVIALISALHILRTMPALHPGLIEDVAAAATALSISPQALVAIDAQRAKFEAIAQGLAKA